MGELMGKDLFDFQQVIFFLLPGFFSFIFYFYLIPARKKSELEVIIWSVAASVILSFLVGNLFNFLNYLSRIHVKLVATGLGFDLTRVGVGLLLAFILAKLGNSRFFFFLNNILGIKVYSTKRLWSIFFNVEKNIAVKVFLNNGVNYIGIIHDFSVDPNDDILELELWKPLYLDKSSGKSVPIKDTLSVLIEGSSISSVEKLSKDISIKLYPDKK